MASLNSIGRALLVVSALSLPALASAQASASPPKPAVAAKKQDPSAQHKHGTMHNDPSKPVHKADAAKAKDKTK